MNKKRRGMGPQMMGGYVVMMRPLNRMDPIAVAVVVVVGIVDCHNCPL